MKYLVTGCNGFVASFLIDLLRRDEDAVVIGIDREPKQAAASVLTSSHFFDLLDPIPLNRVVEREQPDHIIHLASVSSVGYSWQDPINSFRNNTNIFLNVLESVRQLSPRTRILSIGSSEQYGVVTKDELPLREGSRLAPASPYAVARVAQEALGDVYVRGFGLDIVATRSFNHVGAGQTDQFVVSAIGKQFAEVAKKKRDHVAVGTTSVVRDFLDVRDVVAAYRALLVKGRTGEVYNICSGYGVSIDEVIRLFSEIAGVSPEVQTDPALIRPVDNPIVLGSHEKITSAVGWQPRYSLEEALREVYRYWFART